MLRVEPDLIGWFKCKCDGECVSYVKVMCNGNDESECDCEYGTL